MINIENLFAFVLGMVVVYLMFRAMGVFVFVLLLGFLHSACLAQDVSVTNWPSTNQPLPVVISANSTVDVWPAASAGIVFGFVCCGFGWKIRMAKKIPHDF